MRMGYICALIFTAHVALAQPSAETSARSSMIVTPRVDIVLSGTAEDGRELEASLREMLQRLGLALRLTVVDALTAVEPWQAVPPEVVVRVWIDARQPDGILITLSDRRSGRTGAARLVPRRGSRGLLLEETALVVHADTESLLSEPRPKAVAVGAQPLAAAHATPTDTQSSAKPSPEPLDWTLDAMTFAEGQSFAKDTSVVFGAGAGGRVHWGDNAWYPSLWLMGAFHLPFGQSQLPVQLTANVWSGRFVPTWRTMGGHLLTFEAGLGGGVDVFVISPGATEGVGQLSAKRTDVSPIVAALLALHIPVSPTARFTLAATLDWDLSPRRYVAVNGVARDALIQPLSFRPGSHSVFVSKSHAPELRDEEPARDQRRRDFFSPCGVARDELRDGRYRRSNDQTDCAERTVVRDQRRLPADRLLRQSWLQRREWLLSPSAPLMRLQ